MFQLQLMQIYKRKKEEIFAYEYNIEIKNTMLNAKYEKGEADNSQSVE